MQNSVNINKINTRFPQCIFTCDNDDVQANSGEIMSHLSTPNEHTFLQLVDNHQLSI